jgi:hypothetical protein
LDRTCVADFARLNHVTMRSSNWLGRPSTATWSARVSSDGEVVELFNV